MKRWCLMVAALGLASSVQAQTVWIIDHADSAGFTVVAPHEYLAAAGTCTRLDSALTVLDNLVDQLPRDEARREFVSWTATGQWSIYLDVEGYLPSGEQMFTNVNEAGAGCPRTFVSADFLLNPRKSDCLKRAILLHEWRHARDFINGRAPLFMLTQAAPEKFSQELELLEFESRAYREQLYASFAGGCDREDAWYASYRKGGLPGLRRTIATTYGLVDRYPAKKKTIWNACQWLPWEP